MAISSLDGLIAGMVAGGKRLPLQKPSLANQVVGHECSFWRQTGFPAQGSVPGAAAICNAATTGALPLATRTGGQERIIAGMTLQQPTLGQTVLVEDRLGHMGGLSGTVATAQTVSLDIHANIASNNLAERVGDSDYNEIEWYLEWYTATGATIATATANVTFHDATTGSVNVWVLGATALPATVAAGRRYKLSPNNGKFIRSVQDVTLSVSTGTVGSFGVTAVRRLCEFECTVANILQVRDWTTLAAPKVADNACVTLAMMANATTGGAYAGTIRQAVA